jgi:hypothetical protein
MTDRYAVRPDAQGHTVFDVVAAEPAVIAMTPQKGLSKADAEHTARLLNARDREPVPAEIGATA